jgi:hypothetical protein
LRETLSDGTGLFSALELDCALVPSSFLGGQAPPDNGTIARGALDLVTSSR